MPVLQRFFYFSRMTSEAHLRGVAHIAQVAHAFTRAHGISGVLVLDGEFFCEYLEGPAPALQSLVTRLQSDPRHTGMKVLIDDALQEPRRFTEWHMAFMLGGEQSLQSLEQLDGQAALMYFMDIVPTLEKV